MVRVALRQLRNQVAVLGLLVPVVLVVLVSTRPSIPAGATDVFDLTTRVQRDVYQGGLVLLAVLPALVGAFVGAPLVARELENGTHLLAWSQSVTRTRWLVTKIASAAVVVATATGAMSLAMTRWARALDGATGARQGSLPSRLTPIAFAMRGVVPIGYALFALVVGVLAGVVLRRSLPAMAVTIAVVVGLQIVVPIWVRPHLVDATSIDAIVDRATFDGISLRGDGRAPVLLAHTGDHDDWILRQETVDAAGRPASLPATFLGCVPDATSAPGGGVQQAAPTGKAAFEECLATLAADGYRQHLEYLPASIFWTLQWRELALFLAGTAVLIGASVAAVRRA